ncbi:MAG: hypothetical protein QNJ47_09720 [Nostocaceae cyanobacterium]|nr:hypothetical protein [Nostocaceae cyanobacterium]
MSNEQIKKDGYDRNLIPAETAARIEREGGNYKQTPEEQGDIETSAGYTVDNEGLVNNFAVEPEMYYEEPGDRKAQKEAEAQQRAQELSEVNKTDEKGKLTMEADNRGRGVGII